jgi:hypothetical protein
MYKALFNLARNPFDLTPDLGAPVTVEASKH